jgi:hypothetical protein
MLITSYSLLTLLSSAFHAAAGAAAALNAELALFLPDTALLLLLLLCADCR